MFSAGLPILYPIACLSFFVLYSVYKCLLLKYYSKTSEFTQDLPLRSIDFMKYGIILHYIIGAFMLTNSSILATSVMQVKSIT